MPTNLTAVSSTFLAPILTASTTTTATATNVPNPRDLPPSVIAIFIVTATTSLSKTATTIAHTLTNEQNSHDGPPTDILTITTQNSSDVDSILTCLHCELAFTSYIAFWEVDAPLITGDDSSIDRRKRKCGNDIFFPNICDCEHAVGHWV
ncbi:hypothetical protein SprV_0100440100 [Sparganum proliferum]